ncbi:hypothetical protein COT64_02570 [Candidatus Shapirobacteria bacterium CG09_land_8_20_14_0_10_39_12]|uniref:Uncharacterized protein n=1 Tax=Candidatus Shapirobacteria bacterium CG09_land_8_20_14_0_10_39_12 TaxID=1974885 RepID=A0A2H0WP82_9BACT|nr:MAG: hypothetical protein COT64_02570 [Candidatus Shapirobacteria bacterium CG09_land_8_20_14_0_10_39_12]
MAKEKTKAITKKIESELVWAGASSFIAKPGDEKGQGERRILLIASKALGVSPFGVNILGGLPYINKLGLAQKAKGLRFEYNWIKFAEDDNGRAICQCRVMGKDGKTLTDWVVGECSPSTQRMSTLKGYQNHMAQTRAKNRAILECLGAVIHEEMMANIAKMAKEKQITPKQALDIGSGAGKSAEEMEEEQRGKQSGLFSLEGAEKLKELARKHGAKPGEEKKFLEEMVGHSVDFKNPSAKYIGLVEGQLLAAKVKNGK